jgi:hypothetical protein
VAETHDKPPNESAPALEVRYGPAGRDTLAEIVGELAPSLRRPKPAGTEPTLTVGEGFVEHETLAAIHAELLSDSDEVVASAVPADSAAPLEPPRPRVPRPESRPAPASPRLGAAAVQEPIAATQIFQLLTFVVRGTDVSRLASERARRQFVEQTLLERLPVHSIDEVERIDASPWTEQQSVVLRVLCRVSTDDG